jgi:hypothetical protein
MFEQVLMYSAMAKILDPRQLRERIRQGRAVQGSPEPTVERFLDRVSYPVAVSPVVVVDRWGSDLRATAGLTLDLLNGLLRAGDGRVSPIEVFVAGSARAQMLRA